MNVLVLGGYGVIGAAVCRHLLADGHHVTGLGRNVTAAQLQVPEARWIATDISSLLTPEAWAGVLHDSAFDAIVNCSGALQNGSRDRLADVQDVAMRALFATAPEFGVRQFVQISASRAAEDASTEFMRTKGAADRALATSALEWTILRPGLVLSPQAYGGTALLRALAAMPCVLPVAFADRRIQTVHVEAVAEAVGRVLAQNVASHKTYDLMEDASHSLLEILQVMRGWMGLAPVPVFAVPQILVRFAGNIADILGWLGWRSPLRSTAIEELSCGVVGDPSTWEKAAGQPFAPLQDSLQRMPATIQERWFARLFFLKPMAIAILSIFWLMTGIITLLNPSAASSVLIQNGGTIPVGPGLAMTCVLAGAFVDIVLGAAIVFRRYLLSAACGMIAVTCAYLLGGTVLTPGLWLDPLGPLVKAVPAMFLALVVLAMAQDR